MEYETIKISTDSRGVTTISLNRPNKHNALSEKLIEEFTLATNQLREDGSVRVVVLTGEGITFCAGADLGWMRKQHSANRAERIAQARKLALMLKELNEFPKPLIGRIQGQTYGGGVGLMCVCDSVVAVNTAKFGLTETRIGLIPATIGPYVIAKIGEGRARRIFMSSRIFDSGEALTLGFCSKVVPIEELDAAIEMEVEPYLSTAPGAVAEAKALARTLGANIDNSVVELSVQKLADVWETKEANEGISAFFEKRNPSWIKSD